SRNEPLADRVSDDDKYDWDRARLPLECCGHGSPLREDQIGLPGHQLFRENPDLVNVAAAPTNLDPQIRAVRPTQLGKPLREPGKLSLSLEIVFAQRHEHADPPRPVRFLRECDERPCDRCAPKQTDELPPF